MISFTASRSPARARGGWWPPGARRLHADWSTPCASARTSTTSSRRSAARGSPTTTTASAASRSTCRGLARQGPRVPRPLRHVPGRVRPADPFNTMYIKRLGNVCVITREQAIDYGLVGPNLRGSGWTGTSGATCRTAPTRTSSSTSGGRGLGGHRRRLRRPLLRAAASRWWSRLEIVRQALETIPEGEILAKVPRQDQARGRRGRRAGRVRARRDGLLRRLRRHREGVPRPARTGSFMAMGIIEDISRGLMMADLVALIASLDVVAPEIDR